jgi:hypothetical protein
MWPVGAGIWMFSSIQGVYQMGRKWFCFSTIEFSDTTPFPTLIELAPQTGRS